MSTLYHADFDGLSGNEDVGQMSAWYILTALGMYQVEPAGGKYVFGSPLFNSAEVQVGDKTLFIIAHNNSAENMFIQSVRWNGMPYDKSYIDFKDLQQGGTLEFEMGAYPSETFGVAPESRP
jgi:putative alpha-1,2-mannosidase